MQCTATNLSTKYGHLKNGQQGTGYSGKKARKEKSPRVNLLSASKMFPLVIGQEEGLQKGLGGFLSRVDIVENSEISRQLALQCQVTKKSELRGKMVS